MTGGPPAGEVLAQSGPMDRARRSRSTSPAIVVAALVAGLVGGFGGGVLAHQLQPDVPVPATPVTPR